MGSISRSVFAPGDTTVGIRRYTRRLFSVPITLQYLGSRGVRTTRGITLNLSEGGLGALVQGKLRLGETVAIDFFLHERNLSTVAIVRHTSNVQSGFEFLGLTADERQQITNFTANVGVNEEATRSPMAGSSGRGFAPIAEPFRFESLLARDNRTK